MRASGCVRRCPVSRLRQLDAVELPLPEVQLIRQPGQIRDRLFEIEFDAAGAEVYCFTFG